MNQQDIPRNKPSDGTTKESSSSNTTISQSSKRSTSISTQPTRSRAESSLDKIVLNENTSTCKGKVFIVTGASNGLGKACAKHLLELGARVIFACRSVEKTLEVMKSIRFEVTNKHCVMEFLRLDLSDYNSIRSFVKDFLSKNIRLDCLICNAGVWMTEKKFTKTGTEMTMGVNHYGHFLLANLLKDKLIESAPSRVVIVSSGLHSRGDHKILLKDPELKSTSFGTFGQNIYSHSKLANMIFANKLSQILKPNGVNVIGLHPGVVDTGLTNGFSFGSLLKPLKWMFFEEENNAGWYIVRCAVSPSRKNQTGVYYDCATLSKSAPCTHDQEVLDKFWDISMKVTGLDKCEK